MPNEADKAMNSSHKSGCVGTRLFLDTEWADERARELVSLALVDETGKHQFYAEVDPLPVPPTEFARFVVYPLLERGWAAMRLPELLSALERFLMAFDRPLVVFDHPNDGLLLARALGQADSDSGAPDRELYQTQLIQNDLLRPTIEGYFESNHASARLRHRADVDAQALRWAVLRQECEVAKGQRSDG